MGATTRALASQVHPVFMLPPLAASVFGAVLAGEFLLAPAAAHLAAMFFAVYTAHVKDGYVDYYGRGEDDSHPMTAPGCRVALAGATAGFAAALTAVYLLAGPVAALVTLPTWFIGFLHAPQFDTNPVTATVGYPTGIGLCIVGGFAAQTGTVAVTPLAFAAVFLLVLSGIKVVDDATDYEYDRSIDKRTVAVVLGRRGARRFAYGLIYAGFIAVLWLTVDGVFPPSAPAGILVFGVVAAVAGRAEPELATKLLIRGAYLFLAVLVAAVWFRPLAGVPLPDVGVLGPYTYLATEVVFGSAALAVLVRRGALRAAAYTVFALYPIAYLWDWYTLEVGVFDVALATGIELFGIPLEEHLFMVVVPAVVLAVRELVLPVLDE